MGELIAMLRKQQGMTQQALADQMGVTDKAVSKWERDLACPDIKSIPRMAEVLGVSVDDLLQVKQKGAAAPAGQDCAALIRTILQSVALAMGVAVVVLNLLGALDPDAAVTMLGIAIACLAANGM